MRINYLNLNQGEPVELAHICQRDRSTASMTSALSLPHRLMIDAIDLSLRQCPFGRCWQKNQPKQLLESCLGRNERDRI